MKRLLKYSTYTIIAVILSVLFCDWLISSYDNQCFSSVEEVPPAKVGLLLGTTKHLNNGNVNLYYKYRIEATMQLYNSKKIEYVLISGDNSRNDYDEPSTFKAALVALGIPEEKIYLDYAGFRTLDSVVRAKEVFGEDELIIISQPFHNERALFLAKHKKIKAVAFNSKDVSTRYGLKVMLREKLARVKSVLDIFILNTQPKFLGKPISIN